MYMYNFTLFNINSIVKFYYLNNYQLHIY